MFDLSQPIDGGVAGVRGLVYEHAHFAGAGVEIEAHLAPELALGLVDIAVSWAGDLVDPLDGFGSEGQGCDGGGAAGFQNFRDTHFAGGDENGVGVAAVGAYGRGDDESLDARA